MKSYLDIVYNIIYNGIPKQPTRMVDGKAVKVENGTIGLPAQTFIHDMRTGFPALTTRKIAFKSTMIELEGFIKGITDKNWYQERGCKFWDGWANRHSIAKDLIKDQQAIAQIISVPIGGSKEDADKKYKEVQKSCKDLGPIYGYQWRKFGEQYGEITTEDFIEGGCCPATGEYQQIYNNVNGLGYFSDYDENKGDQLKSIVNTLKNNPYDRRMVCSAWNPNQMDMMALPPCHFAWNVVVYGDTISLVAHMRSTDLLAGAAHNIASYAVLLSLLAKTVNLQPWLLKLDMNDCHIYENQIEDAKIQVSRKPYELPQLEIKDQDREFDIFKWTHEDCKLINYIHHDPIKYQVTI